MDSENDSNMLYMCGRVFFGKRRKKYLRFQNIRICVNGALLNQSEVFVPSCSAPPQEALRDEIEMAAKGIVQLELYWGPHIGHPYIFF